jgi:predicted ATPase
LLRSRRQQLHARIVATLEAQFPEIVTAQPQLIAQHCAEAGLTQKGVGYWLKAGQQAVAHSAMTEAESQLRKGLNLLTILPPDDPSRRQQELDLQIALGPALIATEGYGAPPVGETYTRARELAEQLDRPDCLVPLLGGQFTFHMIRGEYKLALPFAGQMEMIGKARNDAAALFSGLSNHAYTRFLLGEIALARTLFERCLGLDDLANLAARAPQDAHVTVLASLAAPIVLRSQTSPLSTYLGYVDQARAKAAEAVSEARKLGHAFTLAFALVQSCFVSWISRGSPDEAHRHANEMLTLAEEHNFPFYVAWGMIHRGWSLAALGQGQEGITLLRRGLSMVRATATVAHTSDVFIKLAEAHARLGQRVETLNCLDEAAQIIEAIDERYHEAELHRLRGELTMAKADRAAAEHNYRQALAVAERQGAKLMELCAATNLAALWRDQGQRAEARDLLAPIYGWFTEGFDTLDLKEAKALLEQLAA